jgi:hypothetical protein
LVATALLAMPAPASAADPPPTMTFKGSLNVLGLLNSLTVTPAALSVPSGGTVTFVNSSPNDLRLTVGGRDFPLAKGARLPLVFPGGTNATRSDIKASPLGGVVGGLLASTATVNVAAAPKAEAPKPQTPDPTNTGGTSSYPPGAPARAGTDGTVVPQSLPGGVKVPPDFGRDPVARGRMAGADLPPITEAEAGAARPDPAQPRAANTARGDGVFTTVGGGIGLLILVATVLLGGVGTAAIRTVLGQRDAEMLT